MLTLIIAKPLKRILSSVGVGLGFVIGICLILGLLTLACSTTIGLIIDIGAILVLATLFGWSLTKRKK